MRNQGIRGRELDRNRQILFDESQPGDWKRSGELDVVKSGQAVHRAEKLPVAVAPKLGGISYPILLTRALDGESNRLLAFLLYPNAGKGVVEPAPFVGATHDLPILEISATIQAHTPGSNSPERKGQLGRVLPTP